MCRSGYSGTTLVGTGRFCRDPAGNVWCEAHEHVRYNKNVEAEAAKAGLSVKTAGVPPGCEMSVQAFSPERNTIRWWPPEWMDAQDVRPVDIEVEKHSTGMWPYEGMWEEGGGYKSNDERRAIAQAFFDEIRKGESLAFFYVDERNPMFIDTGDRSPSRVLAGISRIIDVGEIQEWEETRLARRDQHGLVGPVPARLSSDGIRFPLQTILAAVPDPTCGRSSLLRSTAALGRTSGTAARGCRRTGQSQSLSGRLPHGASRGLRPSWSKLSAELEWLNRILLELWRNVVLILASDRFFWRLAVHVDHRSSVYLVPARPRQGRIRRRGLRGTRRRGHCGVGSLRLGGSGRRRRVAVHGPRRSATGWPACPYGSWARRRSGPIRSVGAGSSHGAGRRS